MNSAKTPAKPRDPGPSMSVRVASELSGVPEFEILSLAKRLLIRSERIRGEMFVDLDDVEAID